MSKTSKPSSSTQSKNGNEIDTFDASEYEFNISASLMTKILEDSVQDTVTKHCDTCTCSKSQNKPFCYNESYYSIATQTHLSGDMKNNLCLNCNAEIKSVHSNMSIRSASPHGIKLVNDKISNRAIPGPMYIIPQTVPEIPQQIQDDVNDNTKPSYISAEPIKADDKIILDANVPLDNPPNMEDLKQVRKNSTMNMEPAVHHKLCDRTKHSISSKKSSIANASVHSVANEDLLIKDMPSPKEPHVKNENQFNDHINVRKGSQSSMGAISRTSSIAKSTVSTHKSNTQVGPGPRFCHLRMQAGSKNILLDNAEPDLPPVLYRRQSKCNENSIFKDLNDDLDNFIDLEKNDDGLKHEADGIKNENVVVESTLIDVHVDNNNKESNTNDKNATINPILLNVSSSPLQPLKTHNFSNSSEHNNNNSQSIGSQQNTSEIDNLLNDFTPDANVQNNNNQIIENSKTNDIISPVDNHDVKIFNFDRYEQNKLASQYNRPLRKIDMSQLHSIENTKISKDFPPQGDIPKLEKKVAPVKSSLPAVVNVYPNLTQTHLKVNESKKVFTNEQSTSSLSSDDSAALLQKQQLLRVAEWVEKNLEQQNSFNDPLEDEVNFNNRPLRRDSKLCRLTETLNELALNMPHPVSKYSKSFSREGRNSWVHNKVPAQNEEQKTAKQTVPNVAKITSNVVKETIFPVESDEATVTENKESTKNCEDNHFENFDVDRELRDAFKANGDKEITAEDLARMEYNVKKFLLSGPHWAGGATGRSRRTSSKTETDV